MRQRAVDLQIGAVAPYLEEDEQAGVLGVAQHVVLDAAFFPPAGFDIGAEQRLELVGLLGFGVCMKDEAVGLGHGDGLAGDR
ncbi:hypothetical protein FQZ97_1145790 [compost metagenome]